MRDSPDPGATVRIGLETSLESCTSRPSLSLLEALDTFREAGTAKQADARLFDHLAAAQALLGDDLAWVEQALAHVADDGLQPATQAARHLIDLEGKRVRPQALLLSAACFGPIPAAARTLALVAELVHSASLLHDDVADEGLERRGAPAARRLYGNAVSVLAGDLLLVHAIQTTAESAPEVVPALLAMLRQLIDGEVVQLRGRTRLDVSEATYDRILRDKTASLFAWSTRSGARVAGAASEYLGPLARFGELIGIAFQLIDDVLDYSDEDTGKTSLLDLREGKLTLPLVLAAERNAEILESLARIHAGDEGPLSTVGRWVVESGACEEVRRRAIVLTEVAVASLAVIPVSPARRLLESVARELAIRVR